MKIDTKQPLSVGIIGGTGALGNGLAIRWAQAGLAVTIGSRQPERAKQSAEEIVNSFSPVQLVNGTDLLDCARSVDIVVVAVPWDAHAETIEQIREVARGKIVIDVVVPLGFDKNGPFAHAVSEGSAAEQAQSLLPESHVVAAFHHVSAVLLSDPALAPIETDIMVLGEDKESIHQVQDLVDLIPGMRGIYGGRLRNAGQAEALTANLIAVNRRYKTHAGIRLTNVDIDADRTIAHAALASS